MNTVERVTLTFAKIFGVAVLVCAGAGFGAYLYAPNSGFLYAGGLPKWAPFAQIISFGELGLLLYANLGIGIICAAGLIATIYARGHRLERFMRPFALYALAAYIVGIIVGLATTLVSGHTPQIAF
jgi:hypothetical protein